MTIEIDPEATPKSAIAYALAQAILALGKDDLKRTANNIQRATTFLADYAKKRKPK
jgi:hypothetical protein